MMDNPALHAKQSTNNRPEGDSKPSMLHDLVRHPLYGLTALALPSILLWFIGRALGADDTLSSLLCLPLGVTSIAFCPCIPSFAKDDEKKEDKAKVPKIAYVCCFIMAFLAFLFLLPPLARDFSASVDPPAIKLVSLMDRSGASSLSCVDSELMSSLAFAPSRFRTSNTFKVSKPRRSESRSRHVGSDEGRVRACYNAGIRDENTVPVG